MIGFSQLRDRAAGSLESSDAAFENPSNEVITRRLKPSERSRRDESNETYLDVLPTFEGKDFLEILRSIIEEKRENGNGPVRILDIGGGAGLAMLDLRDEFSSDELEIVVIGNEEHTHQELRDSRGVSRDPTSDELKEKGIRFVNTNFLRAHRDIGTNSFDVVLACYSLNWIDYSPYSIFKKVWRQLVSGGIAFLAPFSGQIAVVGQREAQVENLWSHLNENYGFDINMNKGGISFERNDGTIFPTDIEHCFVGKSVKKFV